MSSETPIITFEVPFTVSLNDQYQEMAMRAVNRFHYGEELVPLDHVVSEEHKAASSACRSGIYCAAEVVIYSDGGKRLTLKNHRLTSSRGPEDE